MVKHGRIVVAGAAHHVTQRGNRRQKTFFQSGDYRTYLQMMAIACRRFEVEIWAYCLMPNHVHLIAVPSYEESLRAAISSAHEHYSKAINFREGWQGHLWQGRFFSTPMDDDHLEMCARYVELNPIRSGLSLTPWAYPWSSARAHVLGEDDQLAKVRPLLDRYGDWRQFLSGELPHARIHAIRHHSRTGKPLASKHVSDAWSKK
jgi:putative transposase